jgi:hypothetical protein
MKSISADMMVAEFLKAELHSTRFRDGSLKALEMCGYEEELIERPDVTDSVQNEKRAKVLGLCRGWPDKWLFTDIPSDTEWFSLDAQLDDLKRSYRLKSDDDMDDTERLLQTTAERVMKGQVIKNIDNAIIYSIREKIENHSQLPPVILVCINPDGKKVLIEGHSRSVAYASFERLDFDIPAIIGISERMGDWAYF